MLVCMQIVQVICSRLTEYAELKAGVAAVCAMAYTHLLFGLHLSVGRQACMSASPDICTAAFTQKAGCCVLKVTRQEWVWQERA